MLSLKFKQLLIISNTTESGNLFQFQDRLNLITAKDNSVGKSTLAKLLFWALGCDPSFDTTWENLDCKVLLKFQVGEIHYQILRYKNLISLKEPNLPTHEYAKITGEFSKKMAQIVRFHALLPKQNSDVLETPPPAYFFLPFYIDQIKSWSVAWNNFDNLQQYSDWRRTIIKYHIGLLKPEHFSFEEKYSETKIHKDYAIHQVDRINTTLEVVGAYIPKFNATINQNEFSKMTREIQVDLKNLTTIQEDVLDKLSKFESEKVYLENQRSIAEKIVLDLEKDYRFSVENLPADEVECPLCGTIHENSVISRSSILTDKGEAEGQLNELINLCERNESKLIKCKEELEIVRNRIDSLNEKYFVENDNIIMKLPDIIESFAATSIQKKVEYARNEKIIEVDKLKKDLLSIRKQQKDLLTETEIEAINSTFMSFFVSNIKDLDAEGVNLNSINSPTDFNKIVGEGGAAEQTRGLLAYYFAIYSLAELYGNDVLGSLVIDTPNQQEQSTTNYSMIVNLIINKTSKDKQVILCAMDSEQLDSYKKEANIINLDRNKLLFKSKYHSVKKEFDDFLSIG